MKTQQAVHDWAKLENEAKRLGLVINNKTRTVADIQVDLAEATDEAQALANLSESDDGLTAEQNARWTELVEDTTGIVDRLGNELKAARKLEGEKKKIAAMRLQQEGPIHNPLEDSEYNQATGQTTAFDLAMKQAVGRSGRVRAFPNTEKGRHDAYTAGMWLRAAIVAPAQRRVDKEAEAFLSKNGVDIQNVATTTTETAIVPTPLESAIIERRESVGVLRGLASVYAMSSKTHDVPKLTAGPAVTYPTEGAAPGVSGQTWGSVSLSAVTRMVLGKISRELQADALVNAADQYAARAGFELAKQEDNEAVNGDGTATYGSEEGLLDQLGAGGINTGGANWDAMTLAHHTDTMALLPDDYWHGNVGWLCSAAYYFGVMLRIQAAAGGNTIAALEEGGRVMPMFLGFPVHFTGRMPRTTAATQTSALFGNFEEGLALGDRQAVEVTVSEERYWDENNIGVKAVQRIDWNVHEGGDGSNAGAYVGIATS